MLRPATLLRMADLESRLLPGSESMMLSAFFLGSSAGTLLDFRVAAAAHSAGTARRASVGRRRGAPAGGQSANSADQLARAAQRTDGASRDDAGSHCEGGGVRGFASLQACRCSVGLAGEAAQADEVEVLPAEFGKRRLSHVIEARLVVAVDRVFAGPGRFHSTLLSDIIETFKATFASSLPRRAHLPQ